MNRFKLFYGIFCCGALLFVCVVSPGKYAHAGDNFALDSSDLEELNIVIGEMVSMSVQDMTKVSVADPEIADIVDADETELIVIGKKAGQTALFIWDGSGKHTIMVYVFIQSLDIVKARIEKLLSTAGIYEAKVDANTHEGKAVVSGNIPEHKMTLYEKIMEQFHDDTIDLVRDDVSEDLIQVDLQITELNTSLSKNLGINWVTGDRDGISPDYEETQFSSDGHIRDFFKIGHFNRTTSLIAEVNALITEGKGRILSQPKLVVKSGEEASFLVGGEVPIRTTTFSDSGSSQENVEFKEFGVSMTITPKVVKGKIDMTMNLEVSEIDASTASSVSEDVAFSTRSASTHLYLDNHQTVIMAGLIKHSESENVNRIPIVSNIPILGLLFRSRSNQVPDTDQELVIALTPHILTSSDRSQEMKSASDKTQDRSRLTPGRTRHTRQRTAPYYLGIPREMTQYVENVQRRISQSIVYPKEAKQYGWEGTVKVGMLILNDGTLAFALVKESSGHDVFDEVALNTAKNLAPFTAFPPDTDLSELNVTIPIVYSLGN